MRQRRVIDCAFRCFWFQTEQAALGMGSVRANSLPRNVGG